MSEFISQLTPRQLADRCFTFRRMTIACPKCARSVLAEMRPGVTLPKSTRWYGDCPGCGAEIAAVTKDDE
ncbi:hypothetical protein [Amycolatopsis albispora]|uniref:Uncharacterized protein n=1 Tax=Amycolatopsis albispora TaxID=1804986 RepID=A0A344LH01_9PSEU|nr:hypothetical protein [Amycolatopsis albispora]AXB47325.1 hypothetical protein A4R43_36770 [Amycolatopsis albispora]